MALAVVNYPTLSASDFQWSMSLQMLAEKGGDTGLIYNYLQFPLLHEPGAGYGISARVLGTLVERASGQSLDKFFVNKIFTPLGMYNTFYKIPEDQLDRRVTLQVRENGGWENSLFLKNKNPSWSGMPL